MQDAHCGMPLGSKPVWSEGSRMKCRAKLNCNAVMTKALADPTGSCSLAGMAFQTCPALTKQVGCRISLEKNHNFWMK